MQYPLISEYVKAIQDAGDNLDKLSYLTPVLDDHGEPYRSSGAFAVVFKMLERVPGNIMPSSVLRKNRKGELMPIVRLQMNWIWLILHILLL